MRADNGRLSLRTEMSCSVGESTFEKGPEPLPPSAPALREPLRQLPAGSLKVADRFTFRRFIPHLDSAARVQNVSGNFQGTKETWPNPRSEDESPFCGLTDLAQVGDSGQGPP